MYPPKGLIQECNTVDVEDGATTKEELLRLVSKAYIETLKNITECNIKTKEAINYLKKVESKNVSEK